MLRITINEYIKKIKAQEVQKAAEDPNYQPLYIPSTQDLAAASGHSLAHYYKVVGRHAKNPTLPRTKNINRAIPGRIMRYLQSLGFDTEIWDILTEDGEDGY